MLKRLSLAAPVVTLALALAGCSASSESCIVLANGGNKLCGGDAAAWCRATDSLRAGSTDPTLQSTQSDCDGLESNYPAQ